MWNRFIGCIWAALLLSEVVAAQPSAVSFQDCSSPDSIPSSPSRITVSQAIAQITDHSNGQRYLNVSLFGSSPGQIVGESDNSDQSRLLATMFTSASVLTFTFSSTAAAFCDTLRPPSPLPSLGNASNYCPLAAGDLAFSTSVPINKDYELTNLNMRVRVVDASSPPLELACTDISMVLLKPGTLHSIYGNAAIALWATVALAILYGLLVAIARFVAAWKRGAGSTPSNAWSQFHRVGFIITSAMSGERLASSPALLRYCTPSFRDVVFQTQWTALLGMVAVRWPPFVYPYLAQTSWASLLYNITLTDSPNSPSRHWDPINTPNFQIPINYLDQISDANSPLFLDNSSTAAIFALPEDAQPGLPQFAFTIGILPKDTFGVCVGLFMIIIAAVIAISSLLWLIDWTASFCWNKSRSRKSFRNARPIGWSLNQKDTINMSDPSLYQPEDNAIAASSNVKIQRWLARYWRKGRRRGSTSFHRYALFGNLIRILVLFHLPVTVFSSYQFSIPIRTTTISSVSLAAISFALFSLLIPIALITRLSLMKTNKLYDDTRSLLFLGPLYSEYASGSHTFAKLFFINNVVLGVVVGCGQQSGTAQAIIILVVEVASALWTSIHLPWGRGAAMGIVSFLFCVCRIITAVLLVILTPAVDVGDQASGWIASAILIIQAVIYGVFFLMLVIKAIEGLCRILFGIPFDKSRHSVDSGLLGVISLSGLFGKRRNGSRSQYKLAHSTLGADSGASTEIQMHSHSSPFVGRMASPPSVLHAGQVRTPYREDMDDENGHILTAWQPIGDALDAPSTSQDQKSSGFTRVRGGRANFDTPFAMLSRPSSARTGLEGTQELRTQTERRHSPQPSGSINLPETFPRHVRTKSQTAIVGDMRNLHSMMPASENTGGQPPQRLSIEQSKADDQEIEGEEEDNGYSDGSRKRHWFRKRPPNNEDDGRGAWNFLKMGRRSEGDEVSQGSDQSEQRPDDPAPSSFVVIRGKGAPGQHAPSKSNSASDPLPPSSWKLTPDQPLRSSQRSPVILDE